MHCRPIKPKWEILAKVDIVNVGAAPKGEQYLDNVSFDIEWRIALSRFSY